MTRRLTILYSLLSILVLAGTLVSLGTGAYPLGLGEVLRRIFHPDASPAFAVLSEIRLPRTLLALIAGGTLGLSGASLQGYLRNPLAEPAILGVNGGAVFGAVLVLYFGAASLHPLALPAGGLAGALLSTALIYILAGSLSSVATLVLAGIALNTLFFSLTSLVLNLAPNPFAVLEVVFWQMGSLADRSMSHVLLALPFIAAGWFLLLYDRRALDALTLGEETARSLGVSLEGLSLRVLLGTALSVGAVVSICGSIGFVGLIVPHMLRPFVRHEPGKLLFLSALGGAVLVLAADIAVRLFPLGAELKLGVLTSLLGAPFFLFLLFRLRRKIL